MPDEEFSIQRAADRVEIQHRIHQFCRAVDRLELEELLEVFHPDGTDDHGTYKGPVAGFIESLRIRHQTVRYSSHHVSNTYIEFADPDEAFAETYFLVWQSVTPASAASLFPQSEDGSVDSDSYELFSSGRYVDHFTRRDGRWRIQHRTAVPGSVMRAVEGEPVPWHEGFAISTRDENDPACELRRKLGLSS